MSADLVAARSFIDTNVLIYADASDEPVKQRAALALLKQLYDGEFELRRNSGDAIAATQK